ncbi:MAG TPA: short-chain dehydrogenase [Thermoanaerobaculia bacterium]|nr:short-chain dehydrogenase [Thermoanaerobaculia bacterium]
MNVTGRTALVLGGAGLVGAAVARELLQRKAREIRIHSLTQDETEATLAELAGEAGETRLTGSWGDVFGLVQEVSRRQQIAAQLSPLKTEDLPRFRLYALLSEVRPDVVVDCINTATGIAYRDAFRAASNVFADLEAGQISEESAEGLLEALYIPRLIRHVQVLYRGMTDAGTRVYVKVGTSGTGGMGLNIPYTHSEERPSRVLLAKSAVAGAQSMLLFLMARTPGAPIIKEIKPAAAIAWKRIAHGPIARRGEPIHRVTARPLPVPGRFSSFDPGAAEVRDEILESVFIDTGENGIFSLEEFAALTTAEQMEFVTPEEIAQYLLFEIEGGNTGHDVMNALDNAVLGPTYRAGLMRHWALERMTELERAHGTRSVAFEMLGPPRLSKLLFEAHLLRETFATMNAVIAAGAEEVCRQVNHKVLSEPELANDVVAVGIPILLEDGRLLRGQKVLVPSEADNEQVTDANLETWARDGWVDLRGANCGRWVERMMTILREVERIPAGDTSSRFLRTRHFWQEGGSIQPGKVVGWILAIEERGGRIKR